MNTLSPLVVIVGRPNVGKSTLFNRFLHRRRAITDPTPGVTRDPIEESVVIGGVSVRLMDTGGVSGLKTAALTVRRSPTQTKAAEAEAAIDTLVAAKTFDAIERADLILLLLDAGSITGADEELIGMLHAHRQKVLCAVNKTEGGRLETEAWNCMRFGFSDFFLISAEHGDHFGELCARIAVRLGGASDAADEGRPTYEDRIRVAVLGKPNTGKSTLTNRLTGRALSIVSAAAGTTRDVVSGAFTWQGRSFQILDTAGIRRKARVTENVEYYSVHRAIASLDDADVVFLLIDAAEGLAEQDKKIAALAVERGKALIFVLNKWDTQDASKQHLKKTIADINIMFAHMDYAPVMAISAKDGTGVSPLLKMAVQLYGELTRRVDTGSLNRALADWVAANPPAYRHGNTFKLRYLVQKSANPVSFIVFASRPDNVGDTYVSYLQNKIRADLGFAHIPVQVEVRLGRQKWEERERRREHP